MTEQEIQAEIHELRKMQAAADEEVRRAYWAYKANPISATLAAALDNAYHRQKGIVIRIEHQMQQQKGGA